MKKTVPVEQLAVGMYVMMPVSWRDHPFLRSKFKIASSKQIGEMRVHGMREVEVDFARSDVPPPELPEETVRAVVDPKDEAPPPKWNPETLVDDALREAIADASMEPQRRAQVVYHATREMMERLLESPTAENIKASKAVIGSLADLIISDEATAGNLLRITSHDFYTYTHSVNVGVTSLMLAKEVFRGSDGHDLHELGAGFFLHDLGKVKVRPEVINKPARLTDEEMQHMRIHPYQGYKLLKAANTMTEESRIIVMEHHEVFDGSGYPKRISGDQIHIYGRICCIADVYDALTAERSYKKAMKPFDALTLMRDKMANHFDKALFRQFVQLLTQG